MFGTWPTHASLHHISKIQLKIIYRCCTNTDLGISHFNFSHKNLSSKVYTFFKKVVVLVTQSTTKLGLQFLYFSVILYNFSKLQLQHTKEVRFISRTDPWKVLVVHSYAPGSQLQPRQEFRASYVVQGAWGGAAGRIPATSPAALAEEVAGEGLGVTGERCVCLHAVGRGLAGMGGGVRWRPPRERLLRRTGGPPWTTNKCRSSNGS
jgi:hypothetical protein